MMMRKFTLAALAAFGLFSAAQAQLKVGTPAGAPNSTLQVAGSQSGTYKLISADRTLDATDYYTAYNTPAAGGAVTLPIYTAVAPATGTIGGRVYHIKNTGSGILTVNAAAGEQIDNQGTTGVGSITLAPGYYAMLISKGTTSGTTWEVALTGNAAGCTPAYIMASLSADQAVPNGTTNTNVNYSSTLSSGGTGITLLANGFFRLQPGNTYRLEALPRARAFADATNGNARFQWYVSGGSYIGNLAVSLPSTYNTSNESASPTAVALITPTVVTDVAVAISYASAGAFSLQASTSYAVVNQLNACGSGTGTSTSVTASNGLTAAGGNVTLGGTLTQNTDVATAGFNQTFSGTGKVGIGTTSPSYKLQVTGQNIGIDNSASGAAYLEVKSAPSGTGATIRLQSNGNAAAFTGTMDNHDMQIYTNGAPKVTVLAGGNVGIATTNPLATLHATGTAGADRVRMSETSGFSDWALTPEVGTGNVGTFTIIDRRNNVRRAVFNTNGDIQLGGILNAPTGALSVVHIVNGTSTGSAAAGLVGINTNTPDQALSVNGNADKSAGGSTWAVFSDVRIKKDIQDYTKGLKEILAIHPVIFRYNEKNPLGNADTSVNVGVIAQEIEQVLPSTVTKMKRGEFNDLRQYNASELTYTLINAIKEQQAQIEELKSENADLKNKAEAKDSQNNSLEKRLAALEKLMEELKKK